MAIKLVTEVMDWAPASLTHREHKTLIIFAENARAGTREIWDSVESPRMLRRARLSQREMYAVIAALVAKGCLEKPVWGGRNHRAKYAIAHLTQPGRSPAERQAEIYAGWWPEHDQWRLGHDQDQHAGKPQTENHDQHADPLQAEPPRSACGKTAPRLPVGTGGDEVPAEGATDRQDQPAANGQPSVPAAISAAAGEVVRSSKGLAGTDARPAPSRSRKTGEITTARIQPPADDQHTPAAVQLQSQATDRYAREAAT